MALKQNQRLDSQQRRSTKLERRCVHCRQLFARETLIRVLREQSESRNQHITLPQTQSISTKLFGRSAYICDTVDCLALAIKGRKVHKALKCALDDDIVLVLQCRLNQLECQSS